MANGNVFSNMMGFNSKYCTEYKKASADDEKLFAGVDFSQGEETEEVKDAAFFLFDEDNSVSSKHSNDDDCLFNFEAEIDENLG